jgi:hypothetical protein
MQRLGDIAAAVNGGGRQAPRHPHGTWPAAANPGAAEPPPAGVLPPRTQWPADDPPCAAEAGLTPADVAFFVEHGYLIKRGLIPAEVLAPWLERLWEAAPEAMMVRRHDPASWVDPAERWLSSTAGGGPFTADGRSTSRAPHHLTPNSQWRAHALGHDPGFVAATSARPEVLSLVEGLLGGPLRRPTRNRGIYSIFPRPGFAAQPEAMLGPHLDQVPMELGGVVYLAPVGRQSGGFTVWPGSHRALYAASADAVNFVPNEGYLDAAAAVKAGTEPVEFAGGAGDVVLTHPFLMHSTGVNTSAAIRHAAILDFNKVHEDRRTLMWEIVAGDDPTVGAPPGTRPEESSRPGRNAQSVAEASRGAGQPAKASAEGERLRRAGQAHSRIEPDGSVELPAEAGERRAVVRWHHDCMEWAPALAPAADMGAGWNLGRERARGAVVEEAPWWEKHGMPLPPPHRLLKEIAAYDHATGVWRLLPEPLA